jgi:hypothetical protein
MKPVFPELRTGYWQVVFAKDQPQYLQLPANTDGRQVETKWVLSWRERLRIFFAGNLYLTLLTFGNPLQPIRVSLLRDEDSAQTEPTAAPSFEGSKLIPGDL